MAHPQRGSRCSRYPDNESQEVQQAKVDMPGHYGVRYKMNDATENEAGMGLHSANVSNPVRHHAGAETRQDTGRFGNNQRM